MTNFASRFKKLRLKKGLTQRELALHFKTSKSNISRYENGYSLPAVESIIDYADFFNVSIDYLLGKSDLPCYTRLPEDIKDFLKNGDLEYLEIASKFNSNEISIKTLENFLDFYKALEEEINNN